MPVAGMNHCSTHGIFLVVELCNCRLSPTGELLLTQLIYLRRFTRVVLLLISVFIMRVNTIFFWVVYCSSTSKLALSTLYFCARCTVLVTRFSFLFVRWFFDNIRRSLYRSLLAEGCLVNAVSPLLRLRSFLLFVLRGMLSLIVFGFASFSLFMLIVFLLQLPFARRRLFCC